MKTNKIIGSILIIFGINFYTINYNSQGETIIAFILGIIFIILGIKLFKNKSKISPTITDTEQKNESIIENKVLYNKIIKVSGTSFHQEELINIASNGLNNHCIEPYDGLSTKEIKERTNGVGQIEGQYLYSIKLEPYKFENEDAIKVLVNDYFGNYIEIGNIPKDEIVELFPLINDNYNFKATAYFVGGRYKRYDFFQEKMLKEDKTIGIRIELKISKK